MAVGVLVDVIVGVYVRVAVKVGVRVLVLVGVAVIAAGTVDVGVSVGKEGSLVGV